MHARAAVAVKHARHLPGALGAEGVRQLCSSTAGRGGAGGCARWGGAGAGAGAQAAQQLGYVAVWSWPSGWSLRLQPDFQVSLPDRTAELTDLGSAHAATLLRAPPPPPPQHTHIESCLLLSQLLLPRGLQPEPGGSWLRHDTGGMAGWPVRPGGPGSSGAARKPGNRQGDGRHQARRHQASRRGRTGACVRGPAGDELWRQQEAVRLGREAAASCAAAAAGDAAARRCAASQEAAQKVPGRRRLLPQSKAHDASIVLGAPPCAQASARPFAVRFAPVCFQMLSVDACTSRSFRTLA